MKITLKLLALATTIFFTNFAHSSEITVSGKMTSNSPGYLSSVDGTFNLKYKNLNLPWGVRVYLHYGFEQSNFSSGKLVPEANWVEISDVELEATSPYTWYGTVSKQLYARGSAKQLTALQFVLKVVLPDGRSFYENGGKGNMSYLQVSRPLEAISCRGYTIGSPECALPVETRN